jgi:two-component system nitrogen regulation response regulator GlnG
MEGTILVADDDRTIRTVLAQALTRAGCRVRATGTASTLWRWVEEGEGDVVVTDVMMPDGDALDLLPQIRKRRPDLPVIVMSAQNTVMTAIRAAEVGAYEYLPKPFDLKEVLGQVAKALKQKERRAPVPDEDAPREDSLPLIGRSQAMQEVYRILARLMNTDLGVMISGEISASIKRPHLHQKSAPLSLLGTLPTRRASRLSLAHARPAMTDRC